MSVYITKAATFLPNTVVNNDDMEKYLGMIDGRPSRAKNIILRSNGIKQRYYALDKTGKDTHTNAEMAANAVRGLFDDKFTIDDIDVLACGTASPEQILPSHGVMVHGELGGSRNIEVVSLAGSCCAGVDALKYAYMSVFLNPSANAVATASEKTSSWMRASYFQKEYENLAKLNDQPTIAFEKEFLRWMLSDGAAALLLTSTPADDGPSLRVDWIEVTSFANTMETCMYAGADKDENGNLHGWASFPTDQWLNHSLFALKQDARLLSENIVRLGVEYLIQLSKKHSFSPDDVNWFLPHLSSIFFKDKILEESARQGFFVPENRWFYNLSEIGNIGSASAFAMLEEIMHSGKLNKGDRILMMVPESARFSYCYCMFTVC